MPWICLVAVPDSWLQLKPQRYENRTHVVRLISGAEQSDMTLYSEADITQPVTWPWHAFRVNSLISNTTQSCFHLWRLSRQSDACSAVTSPPTLSAHACCHYSHALLATVPCTTTARHQRRRDTCVLYGLRSSDHVSATAIELHWLPIEARLQYKLCVLVHSRNHWQSSISFYNQFLHSTVLRSATSYGLTIEEVLSWQHEHNQGGSRNLR